LRKIPLAYGELQDLWLACKAQGVGHREGESHLLGACHRDLESERGLGFPGDLRIERGAGREAHSAREFGFHKDPHAHNIRVGVFHGDEDVLGAADFLGIENRGDLRPQGQKFWEIPYPYLAVFGSCG